jgi:hypothetical protein
MLSVKSELPSDRDLTLLSSVVSTDLNLWNRLSSSLDMDKDSQSSSRLPAGSGRRGGPSRARTGSVQPAPASATSSPSSLRVRPPSCARVIVTLRLTNAVGC